MAKEVQFTGNVQEWWGEVLDKLLPARRAEYRPMGTSTGGKHAGHPRVWTIG